ncbi:MAG: Repair helicase protein [Nitrosopumilales archaeon]|nr:MAG: Repair helicase protein [Nitrosopumilales archaeon]
MGLKDLSLKEEYRSDRENLIEEFFLPCLDNCIEYDRAVEYIALKSLTAYYFGLKSFVQNNVQIRMVTGHRLRTSDLNALAKLYSKKNGKNLFDIKSNYDEKYKLLDQMIKNNKLMIKIAIPISEEVYGSFEEKIGIFRDEHDDVIAFTGTSNETFDPQNRNFESIDVFTSWNDKSRVEIKIKDFENLWQNKTKNLQVYDFEHAVKNNLLSYSAEWALNLS